MPVCNPARVLDALADAVLVVDAGGRICLASAACERLLGWRPGALVGRPLAVVLPDGAPPGSASVRVRALRSDGRAVGIDVTPAISKEPTGQELTVLALRPVQERRPGDVTRALRVAARATANLAPYPDAAGVLAAMSRLLVDDFGAMLARVWTLDEEGARLDLRASAGTSSDIEGAHAHLPLFEAQCPVAVAARTRQRYVVDTTGPASGFDPRWIEREGIASAGMFPLLHGERLHGVLACFFRHPISDDMTELLALFAAMVASLLHDTELFAREQQSRVAAERAAESVRRLQAVTDVAFAHLSPGELLRALMTRARSILDVDLVALMQLTPDRKALVLRAAVGADEDRHFAAPVPVGTGVAGRIAVEREPVIVDDLRAFDVVNPKLAQDFASLLGVPLVTAGALGGVILVATRAPRRFSQEDARVLQLVAERIAVALEHARLYQAEQRARAAAEEGQRRTAFLAEASRVLGSSLDYEATLKRVASLAVPHLADWCSVELLGEPGALTTTPLVVAHVDPRKVELARRLRQQYPPDPDAPRGLPHVLRTGESEMYPEISDELLVASARDPEHLAILRQVGMVSAMAVALVARGRVLGAISFISAESGRHYGDEDLAMAEDLARRAGAAIDNAQLHRATEMAVQARDTFMTIASHELNTPLTALQLKVQSMARLARRGADPAQLAAGLDGAVRHAQRLARLVTSLLDISRLSAGTLRLEREEVDLGEVVRDAAAQSSESLARAGCRLTLRIAPGVVGRWDRARLEQVLSHLLSNALKFGRGRPIEIEVQPDGGMARLVVRDQGIGIAPELHHRIFDRFYRGVSDRNYGGFGLGLWIVRELVEAQGGHITVESAPGAGATFTVDLPRELREQAALH